MRGVRQKPAFLQPGAAERFPDPAAFDRDGLVAFGGDLGVERLLAAYRAGIFPWYEEGLVPMWWSPDPRGLLDAARLHVSRSLQKTLRRGAFSLSWNRCFQRVMTECGRGRREEAEVRRVSAGKAIEIIDDIDG